MTAFIPGLLVGFILGIFSLSLLIFLVILHRPRYEAPTLSRRRNRDRALGTEFQSAPPAVRWEAKATDDERGVNYSFMGATGLEE
jgi:hypothetical protein